MQCDTEMRAIIEWRASATAYGSPIDIPRWYKQNAVNPQLGLRPMAGGQRLEATSDGLLTALSGSQNNARILLEDEMWRVWGRTHDIISTKSFVTWQWPTAKLSNLKQFTERLPSDYMFSLSETCITFPSLGCDIYGFITNSDSVGTTLSVYSPSSSHDEIERTARYTLLPIIENNLTSL